MRTFLTKEYPCARPLAPLLYGRFRRFSKIKTPTVPLKYEIRRSDKLILVILLLTSINKGLVTYLPHFVHQKQPFRCLDEKVSHNTTHNKIYSIPNFKPEEIIREDWFYDEYHGYWSSEYDSNVYVSSNNKTFNNCSLGHVWTHSPGMNSDQQGILVVEGLNRGSIP